MDKATYALLSGKINNITENVDQIATEATEAWLEENVDPDTGYVLDRTLAMQNAAAPADLVGDLKSATDALYQYYQSANLYDPSTPYQTGRLTSATTIDSDSNYATSDYIPLPAGSYIVYWFDSTVNRRCCIGTYDSSKTATGYTNSTGTNNYTFTLANDGFVRISTSPIAFSGKRLAISAGTTVPPWEYYSRFLEFSDQLASIMGNVLYHKKWVACGDSFTAGAVEEYLESGRYATYYKKVYPYYIGNRNNMDIINEAISGSTMAYVSGRESDNLSFSLANGRYTKIPEDADYITLWFGINDNHQNVSIGTIDDNVNTTFYGAWNIVMDHIIRNHPWAKIGIIITNGVPKGYADAERAIAKKWGVPFLDIAEGEQVPLMLRSNKYTVDSGIDDFRHDTQRVSEDNDHPNSKAHEYESTFIENWLRSL